jgi:hypothetical protein
VRAHVCPPTLCTRTCVIPTCVPPPTPHTRASQTHVHACASLAHNFSLPACSKEEESGARKARVVLYKAKRTCVCFGTQGAHVARRRLRHHDIPKCKVGLSNPRACCMRGSYLVGPVHAPHAHAWGINLAARAAHARTHAHPSIHAHQQWQPTPAGRTCQLMPSHTQGPSRTFQPKTPAGGRRPLGVYHLHLGVCSPV